jgi:hypothetical protein
MSDLPPQPANSMFRVRVDGRVFETKFKNLLEAEWEAEIHVAPGRRVEIIDDATGEIIKRL